MAAVEDSGHNAWVTGRGLKVPADTVTAAVEPPASCPFAVVPWDEAVSIEQAALAAHNGDQTRAERERARGGYGGLGRDPVVPDQRWRLTDNDPEE
jgi:hypothetical protein